MTVSLVEPSSTVDWRLTHDRVAAVAENIYWLPIETAPLGRKVLLLGSGGVAMLGIYDRDPFFVGWFPLPKVRHDKKD